jgi:uncharacterized protein
MEHLIVFARFPEPGKAKTRLIPAFGAEQSAAIHKYLALRTIQLSKRFAFDRQCSLFVYFSGCDSDAIAKVFGPGPVYIEQCSGDLGARLANAVQHAFSSGAKRVVVIGTDCFALEKEHLSRAFDGLKQEDFVLGGATDGGYYLIGLNPSPIPVFAGIDWGSSRVFGQTEALVRQHGKSLGLLESLPDVDYAEDVLPLRSRCVHSADSPFETVPGRYSVIIPAINEAERLPATLGSIGIPNNALEIIVIDGGSTDDTVAVARKHGARVFACRPGRAIQMNAGAASATGETLIFLHADTQLPKDYTVPIEKCLRDSNIAGAFRLKIDGDKRGFRWVEWGANVRSSLCQLPYGDQAFFLRSETFFRQQGFLRIPIMEDFELVSRLRAIGDIRILDESVTSSGRRWTKKGIVKTTVINQICILLYKLGVSGERIAKLYRS